MDSPLRGKRIQPALSLKAAVAIMAVVVVVLWWPCLFGPMTPLLGDAQANMLPWRAAAPPPPNPRWDALLWDGMAQYYPWRSFTARVARRGLVPLWNPHQFCGAPLLANGQSAFFYPPNWLFIILETRYAFGLSAALHYFLAGCFMLLLCRELGLRPASGLVGASAFALGGFMVSWTALPTLMNTAAWLPAVAWAIERTFRRRRPTDGLLLAGTLTMSLLAGHLQIAAYVWLAAGLHAAARSVWAFHRRDARPVRAVIAAFSLAVVLASVQLMPTFELAKHSPRGTVSPTEEGFEFRRERALRPGMLPTLVLPDALGSPHAWTRAGLAYSETCGYAGKLTLLLALCAMLGCRSRWALWFALAAGLSLIGAMGGPVARVLYYCVPGMAQAGGFGRLLCVYTFAIAVLAALGADWLTSRLPRMGSPSGILTKIGPWVAIVAAGLICLDLGVWARGFLPLSPRNRVYPPTEVTRRLAHYSERWRVLALTPREEWVIHRRPEALFPPNSATAYGYDSVQGYDSLYPGIYERFASEVDPEGHAPLVNGNMVLLGNPSARALNEAAVKWLVLPLYGRPPARRYVRRWSGSGVVLWENRDAWPRARLRTSEGLVLPGLVQSSGDPNRFVSTLGYPLGGKVIVADTMYPGWRAFVDGMERPISLHPPMFRQVTVRVGERRLEMVYFPSSFAVGLFISLIALGIAAGWLTWSRGRRGIGERVEDSKTTG